MAKYNENESWTKNAARGVDLTEPELPTEIDLTNDLDFPTPDELATAITDYLAEKYGKLPAVYGIQIVVSDIEWEEL